MTLRSAPYLWVQLINGGALPLEALLLMLLLAGADPGPLPGLERLLAWALGAAAPALLLWQKPADPRSLLLLSVTAKDIAAQPLDALQGSKPPRVAFAAGVVALLPLLFWLDSTAALASQLSPLHGSERLSCLMGAAALLALMVWQWQQLVQAVWLLAQSPEVAGEHGVSESTVSRNWGLPLLHLPLLDWPAPAGSAREWPLEPSTDVYETQQTFKDIEPEIETEIEPETETEMAAQGEGLNQEAGTPNAQSQWAEDDQLSSIGPMNPEPASAASIADSLSNEELVDAEPERTEAAETEVIEPEVIDPLDSGVPLAVEPEQAPENSQGGDLDQQVS